MCFSLSLLAFLSQRHLFNFFNFFSYDSVSIKDCSSFPFSLSFMFKTDSMERKQCLTILNRNIFFLLKKAFKEEQLFPAPESGQGISGLSERESGARAWQRSKAPKFSAERDSRATLGRPADRIGSLSGLLRPNSSSRDGGVTHQRRRPRAGVDALLASPGRSDFDLLL